MPPGSFVSFGRLVAIADAAAGRRISSSRALNSRARPATWRYASGSIRPAGTDSGPHGPGCSTSSHRSTRLAVANIASARLADAVLHRKGPAVDPAPSPAGVLMGLQAIDVPRRED